MNKINDENYTHSGYLQFLNTFFELMSNLTETNIHVK